MRRSVALFKLDALHRTWSERRALGEDCDPQSKHLEGRRVTSLTTADVHVFAADVLARKNRRDIPDTDSWVRDYGPAFDFLLANPASVEVPDPLKVFCPAAWRVLELAFTKGMLGPDGPNMSPEKQRETCQQSREARRSVAHMEAVTTGPTATGSTTLATTTDPPDERGTLPSEPAMSKLQRLHQLLLDTHPDAGRLLWTLESLPEGKQLLAEISDFEKQKLGALARRAISAIDRQPRYVKNLFVQVLSEHPDHRGEIVEVAGLWGVGLSSAGAAGATGVDVSAPKAPPEKGEQASPKSQTAQASSRHGKPETAKLPPTFRKLSQAYQSGELIAFVGAGVSRAARLPMWIELVEKICEQAGDYSVSQSTLAEVGELKNSGKLIDALTELNHALGTPTFVGIVKELLNDKGREIPPLGKALAALAPKLRAVLTTNLDRLIERAFPPSWVEHLRPQANLGREREFILKLHGTLHDASTWVLTRDQYDRAMYTDPRHQPIFRALMLAAPMLFVGFGLDDADLNVVLGEIRAMAQGQPPQHFALVPEPIGSGRRRAMAESGVILVGYDNSDGTHAGALRLLEALKSS